MVKKIILLIACTGILSGLNAQSPGPLKREYLRGKQMYEEGRYEMAMEILKPLTLTSNKSPYAPYAAYYYSLAAINEDYNFLAEEMLQSTLKAYPDWEQVDLLKFWLVKIYLKEEDYGSAIEISSKINDASLQSKSDELVKGDLALIDDIDGLKELYFKYKDYAPLAYVLADKIMLRPLFDQDRELLKEVVTRFDLDRNKYYFIDAVMSEKKDQYNVAVLFPFMYDDIIPDQVRRNNQFILDLYEGMKLAGDQLLEKDNTINLYAFDTEKDAETTKRIIESGQLEGIDLIIGPLYPGPVSVISEFSLENRINMVNPLSSNFDLINKNPFCFLIKPTLQRQALEAEKYVSDHVDNKHGIIFYENSDSDSLLAYTYKQAIEEDSFNIVYSRKIYDEDTFSVYKMLTRKVKFKEVALTREDSTWYIERYDLYDYFEELALRKEDKNKNSRPLELYVIPPDSIGHIFVASGNELIGTNVISGVGTRGDSILIIGDESWLHFRSLSLEQWELLDILLIAPGFIASGNPVIEDINQKVIFTYNKPPTRYHYLGYETMHFLGNMLHSYGTHFQVKMSEKGRYPGLLFQGFDYSDGNDNAVVPLIKFENSEFKIVNKNESHD